MGFHGLYSIYSIAIPLALFIRFSLSTVYKKSRREKGTLEILRIENQHGLLISVAGSSVGSLDL